MSNTICEECYFLLEQLMYKYPDSALKILNSLEEIRRVEELYEKIENETPEQKEERKKSALSWLDKWKEYGEGDVIQEIKVVKGKYRPKMTLSDRDYTEDEDVY